MQLEIDNMPTTVPFRINKMKLVFFLITLGLSFLCVTCGDDGTSPPYWGPGKRDYSWSIDTISYSGSLQTSLITMWASSANDVWIGGFNERGWGELYHYDGLQWLPDTHGFRSIDISQIFGFESNNVFLAGAFGYINPNPPPYFLDSSVILHYNGSRWSEVHMERGRHLQGIWGMSPTNMFATGIFGTLFHYDGSAWEKINTDTTIMFGKAGGTSTEIFAIGYIPSRFRPDSIYRECLYKWMNGTFVRVDSMLMAPGVVPKFGSSKVVGVEERIYSVGWGGVFYKQETGWANEISVGETFMDLCGTRLEHVFSCGISKSLYHYNGANWKKIEVPGDPSLPLYGVWCNEEEVFVLGSDGARSYVLHGK
jgi:hypothetical protein